MKKIKDKNHNEITMIRGRGLEIAVEMKNAGTCASVIREAQNDGLLLIGDGDKTLQLMPPLTISEDDLFSAVEIFFSALDRAKS